MLPSSQLSSKYTSSSMYDGLIQLTFTPLISAAVALEKGAASFVTRSDLSKIKDDVVAFTFSTYTSIYVYVLPGHLESSYPPYCFAKVELEGVNTALSKSSVGSKLFTSKSIALSYSYMISNARTRYSQEPSPCIVILLYCSSTARSRDI